MKLEPGRTTLSGRPEFLRPAPVQTSAPPVAQRRCAACNVEDIVHLVGGESVHTITIELRYIEAANEEVGKQKVTPYLKARGWRYRYHLGRHAMERDICRPCMEAQRAMRKEFQRKRENELKSGSNSESYYLAVCGGE